jgi:hypothetical protein
MIPLILVGNYMGWVMLAIAMIIINYVDYVTMQYILYALICFLGFAAAGVLGVFVARDWSDILSYNFSRIIIDASNLTTVVDDIRIFTIITSVSISAGCFMQLVVDFELPQRTQ